MKLSTTDQVIIGAWLSSAIALGMLSRSATATGSMLMMGVFFGGPFFAVKGLQSLQPHLRRLSAFLLSVWGLVFLVGVLGVVERLYYANADSYPVWLASGELGPEETVETLRAGQCKGRGVVEISRKAGDQVLLRCGMMFWESKTFLTTPDRLKAVSGFQWSESWR